MAISYPRVRTVTSAPTIATNDHTLLCDGSSGAFSVGLPTAIGNSRRFVVKRIGASGTITVDPLGNQTVDGAAFFALTAQYQAITIVSNGANWAVESFYTP